MDLTLPISPAHITQAQPGNLRTKGIATSAHNSWLFPASCHFLSPVSHDHKIPTACLTHVTYSRPMAPMSLILSNLDAKT